LIQTHRYLVLILFLALVQLGVEFAFNGFTSFPDTHDYVQTVDWFRDGSGAEYPLRIQRPLEILLVVPFSYVLSTADSFKVVNSLLYLASKPFFFSFSRKLLKDDRLAFVSTILYTFAMCVLYWGLALITDMMQWLLVCVVFDLLFDIKEKWRTRDLYEVAVVVGLGILNKESIGAVALILIYIVLKSGHGLPWTKKIGKVARLVPELVLMFAPFVFVQVLMYVYFGPADTFFSYHFTHKTGDIRGAVWYLPVTFVIAFNILLVPFLLGLRQFLRGNMMMNAKEYAVFLIILLLPIVAFEQYSPRLAFLIFPLVIPVAALGVDRVSTRLTKRMPQTLVWILLALYITLNNAVALFGDEVRNLLGIWSR